MHKEDGHTTLLARGILPSKAASELAVRRAILPAAKLRACSEPRPGGFDHGLHLLITDKQDQRQSVVLPSCVSEKLIESLSELGLATPELALADKGVIQAVAHENVRLPCPVECLASGRALVMTVERDKDEVPKRLLLGVGKASWRALEADSHSTEYDYDMVVEGIERRPRQR